jgi:riboflavin biosynthesis pyrimidine reductase
LAKSYGNWTGIRSNHVVHISGSLKDASGSSRGISSPLDKRLLIALRKTAQLILVDASTARAENYRPIADLLIGIVSRSGNFEKLVQLTDSKNTLLFSPVSHADGARSKLISENEPFSDILKKLSGLGVTRVLLESGPTLTKLAVRENVIQESAITITPGVDETEFRKLANPFLQAADLASFAEAREASFGLWRA